VIGGIGARVVLLPFGDTGSVQLPANSFSTSQESHNAVFFINNSINPRHTQVCASRCLGSPGGLAATRSMLARSPLFWYAKLINSGAARDQTPPPCRHAALITTVTYRCGNECSLLLSCMPPVLRITSRTLRNTSTAEYVMLSRHSCRCREPTASKYATSSSRLSRVERKRALREDQV
jgi:hypothetical protein